MIGEALDFGVDGVAGLLVDQLADIFADPLQHQREAESDNDEIGDRQFDRGGAEQTAPAQPSPPAAPPLRPPHPLQPPAASGAAPARRIGQAGARGKLPIVQLPIIEVRARNGQAAPGSTDCSPAPTDPSPSKRGVNPADSMFAMATPSVATRDSSGPGASFQWHQGEAFMLMTLDQWLARFFGAGRRADRAAPLAQRASFGLDGMEMRQIDGDIDLREWDEDEAASPYRPYVRRPRAVLLDPPSAAAPPAFAAPENFAPAAARPAPYLPLASLGLFRG